MPNRSVDLIVVDGCGQKLLKQLEAVAILYPDVKFVVTVLE